jgi:hypothetical protein
MRLGFIQFPGANIWVLGKTRGYPGKAERQQQQKIPCFHFVPLPVEVLNLCFSAPYTIGPWWRPPLHGFSTSGLHQAKIDRYTTVSILNT